MKYTWLVEKYLEGELSGEDLRKFELEILRKPEVAEEVERIRSLTEFSLKQHQKLFDEVGLIEYFDDIENVINEEDIGKELEGLKVRKISASRDGIREFEGKLAELQAQNNLNRYNSNKILVKKVSLWMAATAMAVLIAVSSLLFFGNDKPGYAELYSDYFYPYPADVSRALSIGPADNYSTALDLYMKEEYEKAYQIMDLIPENAISNDFLLYKGITAMEIGEYLTALEIMNRLDDDPVLKHEGQWYKSLCFLALKDMKAARFELEEIIQSNGYHKGKAVSLIRKL
jgi:hypothetical protein